MPQAAGVVFWAPYFWMAKQRYLQSFTKSGLYQWVSGHFGCVVSKSLMEQSTFKSGGADLARGQRESPARIRAPKPPSATEACRLCEPGFRTEASERN